MLPCINDGELRAPGEPWHGPNAPGGRGRRQLADIFIGQSASDLRGCYPLNAIPDHKPQARASPDFDAVQNIPVFVQDPVQIPKVLPDREITGVPFFSAVWAMGRPSSFTVHAPCRIWTLGDSSDPIF